MFILPVTATEVIEPFKSLPPEERGRVTRYILREDKSWIPDSFRQGMAEAEAGILFDRETALRDEPPREL